MVQEQSVQTANPGYGDFSTKEVVSFPSGRVHEDVTLKKVEFFSGDSKVGNAYQAIKFLYIKETDKEIWTLTDQMLQVDKSKMVTWDHEVDIEDTFVKAITDFNARIKHIALQFVTVAELTEACKNVTSFEDFATKLMNLLNPILVTGKKKVRLKVMPNGSNYSEVPKYPKFIQTMDEASDLTITTKEYEKINKIKNAIPKADSVLKITEDDEDDDLELDIS
jgi:hypothetical protein